MNDQILYIVQGSTIKGIDMCTHRFVFEWNLGQPVKDFDVAIARSGSLEMIAAS